MIKPLDVLRTALSNLARHRTRTVLTTIGVIVGILTIVTMVSLGNGVRGEMQAAFDTVGLETVRLRPVAEQVGSLNPFGLPDRTKLLTPELVRELEARDDVLSAVPYLSLPRGMRVTLRIDGRETGVDPRGPGPSTVRDPFVPPLQTLAGASEPPSAGGAVVVGVEVLEQLGYATGAAADVVGRSAELVLYAPRGESQVFPVEIAGVNNETWGNLELAMRDQLAMLEWWYDDPDYLAHRGYDEVTVHTRSLADAARVVDWLAAAGYNVQSLQTLLDMANRGMTILTTMLGSVGGLALLVASIGIANTMIMAVYERTREIGILKAVGASPGQIRGLFVVEASLIGFLGGIAGTILGWLLGKGLNWLILEILVWQEVPMEGTFFVVTWWLVAAALAFATLVGLLAGLYPAARAARLAPLDALRYE